MKKWASIIIIIFCVTTISGCKIEQESSSINTKSSDFLIKNGQIIKYIGDSKVNNTIVIPDGVESIGEHSFDIEEISEYIHIPKSVNDIGEGAFSLGDSSWDAGFTVDKANKNFMSRNGWLYSKDGNRLIYASSPFWYLVVPEGVEYVGDKSLNISSDARYQKIYLPSTLKCINANAIHGGNLHFSGDVPTVVGKLDSTAMYERSISNILSLQRIYVPKGKREEYIKALQIKEEYEMYVIERESRINNSEFVISGNTLYKYNGEGGEVCVPEGVKKISKGAFTYNEDIRSVYLPDSVQIIDDYAFAYCTNLSRINLPEGLKKIGRKGFASCNNIDEIILPQGIKTISAETFRSCERLTKVTIPASVTNIKSYAFERCSNLTDIIVPASVTTMGYNVFEGCDKTKIIYDDQNLDKSQEETSDFLIREGKIIQYTGQINVNKTITIPEGVTSIGAKAFCVEDWDIASSNIKRLSICIPKEVSLEKYAFTDALPMNVTFEEGRTVIDAYAFYNTTANYNVNMTVTLPSSIKKLENYSFYNEGIKKIDIILNEGLEVVGNYALYGTGATLPSTVTILQEGAVGNCDYYDLMIDDDEDIIENSKTIKFPEGLEVIGDHCVNIQYASEYIYIPASVKAIGEGAFRLGWYNTTYDAGFTVAENNKYFKSVNGWLYSKDGKRLLYGRNWFGDLIVPEGVEYVGEYSLTAYGLDGKKEIYFPSTIKKIHANAAKSGTIHFTSDVPAIIGKLDEHNKTDSISRIISVTKIYVPKGKKEEYIKALQINPRNKFSVIEEKAIDNNEFIIQDNNLIRYNGKGGAVCVPEGVERIEFGVFAYNEAITSIQLPDSVKKVYPYAFAYCFNLKTINIPKGVEHIYKGAFDHCINLDNIILPNSITSIGDSTFKSCESLTNITIPASIEDINQLAFYGCDKLESIYLPDSINSIDSNAFLRCNNLQTIYGIKGSDAERFAKENGYQFIVKE